MESSTRKCGRQQRGPESDGRAKSLGPTNRVVGTERRLWASCRALGSNLSDRSKWGLLAGSRDMFRYRRQMRKFFGVFGPISVQQSLRRRKALVRQCGNTSTCRTMVTKVLRLGLNIKIRRYIAGQIRTVRLLAGARLVAHRPTKPRRSRPYSLRASP